MSRSILSMPVAGLLTALLVVGCGNSAPTPVPNSPSPSESGSPKPTNAPSGSASPSASSGPGEDGYEAIEAVVREIRELEEQKPVEPEVLDEAALGEYVRAEFDEQNPPAYVEAYNRLLKHLGLVAQDADVQELYFELLESQVLGLYDPQSDRMFVVSRPGTPGVLDQATYAHEYGHALQDQAFDLEAVQAWATDQGDRSIARLALIEGDAMLIMTLWAQQELTPEQLLELATSSSPEQDAVLERMPAILREQLLFPYTAGLNYVLGLQLAGGWDAVDAAFADPPDTTEQILHPERADEPAVEVTFPPDLASGMGQGWSEALQDTFGEFQLGVWLREAGLTSAEADAIGEGWGGDRLVLLEGPSGAWATAVEIVWDSATDADAFRAAAGELVTLLEDAGGEADVLPRDQRTTTVVVGSDANAMGRLANRLGLAG
ncbi:MAG TPA: hypothetical protein VFK54_05125 [Candidatus Limnocylindrales bacterium]|nr:hypothetical protein [Candidatus Limnocylindrales bacterium]